MLFPDGMPSVDRPDAGKRRRRGDRQCPRMYEVHKTNCRDQPGGGNPADHDFAGKSLFCPNGEHHYRQWNEREMRRRKTRVEPSHGYLKTGYRQHDSEGGDVNHQPLL